MPGPLSDIRFTMVGYRMDRDRAQVGPLAPLYTHTTLTLAKTAYRVCYPTL